MSQSRDAEISATSQTEIQNAEKPARKKGFGGDWLDIFLTFAIVAAAFIAIGSFVSQLPNDMRPILLLAGTIAGIIGWGVGIMFSPYGGRDQLSSRGTGRLLTGLIVGFALAWFWQPIKQFLLSCGPAAGSFLSSPQFPIAAVSLIVFLLTAITTYVLRGINQSRA